MYSKYEKIFDQQTVNKNHQSRTTAVKNSLTHWFNKHFAAKIIFDFIFFLCSMLLTFFYIIEIENECKWSADDVNSHETSFCFFLLHFVHVCCFASAIYTDVCNFHLKDCDFSSISFYIEENIFFLCTSVSTRVLVSQIIIGFSWKEFLLYFIAYSSWLIYWVFL